MKEVKDDLPKLGGNKISKNRIAEISKVYKYPELERDNLSIYN